MKIVKLVPGFPGGWKNRSAANSALLRFSYAGKNAHISI